MAGASNPCPWYEETVDFLVRRRFPPVIPSGARVLQGSTQSDFFFPRAFSGKSLRGDPSVRSLRLAPRSLGRDDKQRARDKFDSLMKAGVLCGREQILSSRPQWRDRAPSTARRRSLSPRRAASAVQRSEHAPRGRGAIPRLPLRLRSGLRLTGMTEICGPFSCKVAGSNGPVIIWPGG